jgi:hypothetical protein
LKNGQKLKLGDANASPQEISKKYKHQSLGMPDMGTKEEVKPNFRTPPR